MLKLTDPAAGAAPGQLAGAICVVEMLFGPDPEGRNVGIVAALVMAMRADRAKGWGRASREQSGELPR